MSGGGTLEGVGWLAMNNIIDELFLQLEISLPPVSSGWRIGATLFAQSFVGKGLRWWTNGGDAICVVAQGGCVCFSIDTHRIHVGNIYLHFPLNVAIFHLM